MSKRLGLPRTIACAIVATLAAMCRPAAVRADEAGYLYSYALSDGRYKDDIVSFDAYKPLGPARALRPYIDLLATQDSRTAGGTIPRIYSDNYALTAAGLQYTLPSGFRAFVQAGATTRLGSISAVPSGGDVRAGVQEYREWGGLPSPLQTYGNLYASATYLSRYSDFISYSQLEVGRHLGTRAIELFARGVVTLDSHGYYYSNLAELTLGVRLKPFGARGPALELGQVAGSYLRNEVRPGIGLLYGDTRPTIVYGMSL